ncbi:MAG: hypothetical protein ACYTEQ_22205 [Planctomycetota bacterium]|jgi:hypothetical protein
MTKLALVPPLATGVHSFSDGKLYLGQSAAEAAVWTPASPTDDGGVLPRQWFKADADTWQDVARTVPAVGDGATVAGWTDQTGNNLHASQATVGREPTLRLNVVNSLPVVRFDGVDDGLTTVAYTSYPSKRGSAFIVAKRTGGSRHLFGPWFVSAPFTDEYQAAWNVDSMRFYDGSANVDLENPWIAGAQFYIFDFIRTADTTLQFYRDSALIISAVIANNQPGNLAMHIGSNINNPALEAIGCDIAEFIIYDTALSAADRVQVEDYLNGRYAIY